MVSRAFVAGWLAALGVIALALCGVPLFNLLGFEFAFSMGIPLVIAAGAAGVRARRATPDAPWRAWLRATGLALGLSALPLAIITLNALRVQVCDYLEGLAFYAVIPLAGAITAAGWGVAAARLSARRGVLLFVIALVVTIGLAIARFWMHPPVDVYHPLLGYWPGALYDDVILIDDRLIWSRLEDLGWATALVALSALPGGRRRWLVAGLTTLVAVGLRFGATAHAVHRDAEWVEGALGAVTETEHVRMVHPADWSPETVARLGHEMEFAYAELKRFFGFDTTRKVVAYLYPDDQTKKRLMGARRVRIAKPWQWAFHVHAPTVGQTVLVHEMAHVFSAEIADGPHRLSLYRGLVPHMPMIEGLAEAATWPTDRLDLHQWSAAMRRIEVAPALDTVLAPAGFYGKNSRTAYTLCGSFARYFRDTVGADALAEAYRAGRFDLPGRPPFAEVAADWERFLDGLRLPTNAETYARARFDRPAIFGRACAHEIAALRRAARDRRPPVALARLDEILGHLPRDVSARLRRAAVLIRLGQLATARAQAAELADDDKAGAVARSRAREQVADLDALDGLTSADPAALERARAAYESAAAVAFTRTDQRRLAVKRAALDRGPAGRQAIALLIGAPPLGASPGARRPTTRARMAAMIEAAPDWGWSRYLNGRFLVGRSAARRAPQTSADRAADAPPAEPEPSRRDDLRAGLADLVRARQALGGVEPIALEIDRLIARAAFDHGCFARAEARYRALEGRPGLSEAERSGFERWTRRAIFFAGRAPDRPLLCTEIDTIAAPDHDASRPE